MSAHTHILGVILALLGDFLFFRRPIDGPPSSSFRIDFNQNRRHLA